MTFEEGAVASLAYSGYDHLNSADLASGLPARDPRGVGAAHRAHTPEEEAKLRVASGYSAGAASASESLLEPELGVFMATCARADLRLAPDGVAVYAGEGLHTVAPDPARGAPGRRAVLSAIEDGRPALDNGRSAKAMLRSSREQREIGLRRQATCDGAPNAC